MLVTSSPCFRDRIKTILSFLKARIGYNTSRIHYHENFLKSYICCSTVALVSWATTFSFCPRNLVHMIKSLDFMSLFKNKFIFYFHFFTFSSVSTIFFLIYLYLFQRNTCLWLRNHIKGIIMGSTVSNCLFASAICPLEVIFSFVFSYSHGYHLKTK